MRAAKGVIHIQVSAGRQLHVHAEQLGGASLRKSHTSETLQHCALLSLLLAGGCCCACHAATSCRGAACTHLLGELRVVHALAGMETRVLQQQHLQHAQIAWISSQGVCSGRK